MDSKIEKLVDALLIFMNDNVEKHGSRIDCVDFDFSDEDEDLGAFMSQQGVSLDEAKEAINRCYSRKYLTHHYIGGGRYRGLGLTEEGQGRALSVKFGTPRSNEQSSSVTIETLNVQGSAQVGNNNQQNISVVYNDILEKIESSSFSDGEKEEAKSVLERFCNNPLICAVVGGAVSGIAGKMAG